MNYTKAEVEILHSIYNGTNESILSLMQKLNKSKKSIVGKLAVEKIYQKKPYTTKTGEDVVTKEELVLEICELLNIEYEEGLERALKSTLKNILHALAKETCSGEIS